MTSQLSTKQRSLAQNNALHKYCEELSAELNEVGITQSVLLQGTEVDNSPESVKAFFRALGKAKYLKGSTADLTTKEMSDIYEEVNRHIAKFGIHISWPSYGETNFLDEYKENV